MENLRNLLDKLNICDTYNYHSFDRLYKELGEELRFFEKADKRSKEYLLNRIVEYISINQTDLDITQEHRVFIRKLKTLVDYWSNKRG
jgi:hypothetical protein